MKVDPTQQCPNCGEWWPLGECRHVSSWQMPGYGSTLYGVCRKCADKHRRYGEAMAAASKTTSTDG